MRHGCRMRIGTRCQGTRPPSSSRLAAGYLSFPAAAAAEASEQNVLGDLSKLSCLQPLALRLYTCRSRRGSPKRGPENGARRHAAYVVQSRCNKMSTSCQRRCQIQSASGACNSPDNAARVRPSICPSVCHLPLHSLFKLAAASRRTPCRSTPMTRRRLAGPESPRQPWIHRRLSPGKSADRESKLGNARQAEN
jgi:hypothetical protein